MVILTAVYECAGVKVKDCPGPSPVEEARVTPRSNLSADEFKSYQEVTNYIGTRDEFNNAVLAYRSYATPYSFYLLGIEKPRKNSDRPYCKPNDSGCTAPKFDVSRFQRGPTDQESEVGATREDIEDRLFEAPRSMVLTHALRIQKTTLDTNSENQEGCFIFNIYGDATSTPWCKHRHVAKPDTPKWTWKGWEGLDQLGEEIRDKAKSEKPTHIIVLATGWNTPEYESFLDFKYWMSMLDEDFKRKGEDFRPIFVGITWESEWASPFWAWLPFSSWSTKGNDADEIGFTWANYLLNDVLQPITQESGAQLVAIGHSFGSRIVLGAHYGRHILVRSRSASREAPVTVIGMQAAFPTGRFISTKGKEHQYLAVNKGQANVVITTSKDDEATGTISWGTGYVGGPGVFDEVRENSDFYRTAITVPLLNTESNGQPISALDNNLVSIYDASTFVNCQLPGTDSGAHSDVYDEAMAHFLGEIIRASGK
jgi:hypothetical protein